MDPGLIVHRFPVPHSVRPLIEALQSMSFRTDTVLGRQNNSSVSAIVEDLGSAPIVH